MCFFAGMEPPTLRFGLCQGLRPVLVEEVCARSPGLGWFQRFLSTSPAKDPKVVRICSLAEYKGLLAEI